MVEAIRVVQIGVGSLGSRIVKHISRKRSGIEYVGAIDIRPDIVGKDLGMVTNLNEKMGVKISDDPAKVFTTTNPHIAIHATTSFFKEAFPQIKLPIEHGINVVSTCEQLSYPELTDAKLARKVDEIAKENNATVLGTGINPGFLMDVRPFLLSGACTEVNKIEITRKMNASPRRRPFQEKIGVTLTPEEFEKAIEQEEITGHMGLKESIALIADSLGWDLESIQKGKVKPVKAKKKNSSKFFTVAPGEVKGIDQKAYGLKNGDKKIVLHFTAFLNADPSYDEVKIEGIPDVNARISPCWHGDYGTVGIVVNLIPTVIKERSGLLKMNNIINLSFKKGYMGKFLT